MAQPSLVVPEHLMVPCPDLPRVNNGRLDFLIANHATVTRMYHDCKRDKDDLAGAIRAQQQQK